jgi:hypothetical protein
MPWYCIEYMIVLLSCHTAPALGQTRHQEGLTAPASPSLLVLLGEKYPSARLLRLIGVRVRVETEVGVGRGWACRASGAARAAAWARAHCKQQLC